MKKYFIQVIGNNTGAALRLYRNNLEISKQVGDHPNFMKVHGITVKKIKDTAQTKTYLILEYIEGILLRNVGKLTSMQTEYILSQLKGALVHLYRVNVLPVDANSGNFLITADYTLKLIDFDAWQTGPSLSKEMLGTGLYRIANNFLKCLCEKDNIEILAPSIQTEIELSEHLDNLIRSTLSSYADPYDDDLYG